MPRKRSRDRLDVKLDSVTDRIENKLDVVVARTDLRIDRLVDRMFPLWRAFRAALAAVLVLYIVFVLALRWMPPSVLATNVWWLFVWPVVVAGTLGGGALWFVRRL